MDDISEMRWDLLRNHPSRKKWVEKGRRAQLLGLTADEMDHEDLLMVIGYLYDEQETDRWVLDNALSAMRGVTGTISKGM